MITLCFAVDKVSCAMCSFPHWAKERRTIPLSEPKGECYKAHYPISNTCILKKTILYTFSSFSLFRKCTHVDLCGIYCWFKICTTITLNSQAVLCMCVRGPPYHHPHSSSCVFSGLLLCLLVSNSAIHQNTLHSM